MTQEILTSITQGIYAFPEFSPLALAVFSDREFEASRDLLLFLGAFQTDLEGYCTPKQVHGDRILLVSAPMADQEKEADGLVTNQRKLALVIRTADCIPVFFLASTSPAVGLVHAGWRGIQKGIIFRMIEFLDRYFGAPSRSLRVALGPAIRESCYEVGEEFADYFPDFVRRKESKYYCDLPGVVKKQLVDMNIPPFSIIDSGLCTVCSGEQFFSARREGIQTGRLLSAIMLR